MRVGSSPTLGTKILVKLIKNVVDTEISLYYNRYLGQFIVL